MYYSGGILDGYCPGDVLDHAILTTGYGAENGVMFWNVKNSWGTNWGESGYVRILRTEEDTSKGKCGIAAAASSVNQLKPCQ
mmetsp:Transcript_13756/g.6826  ORF Transcript_13756/g.6826 Transcript_13756/m.6826 type:complete len:82 (-) Transcript_13756:60-305(-)